MRQLIGLLLALGNSGCISSKIEGTLIVEHQPVMPVTCASHIDFFGIGIPLPNGARVRVLPQPDGTVTGIYFASGATVGTTMAAGCTHADLWGTPRRDSAPMIRGTVSFDCEQVQGNLSVLCL
jgi:hypothetical protein